MTGYPPKCPQNGTRHHEHLPEDKWPGDTYTDMQGHKWLVDREGVWRPNGNAAKRTA